MVAAIHLGMFLIDWKDADRRGRIAAGALVACSLALAAVTVLGWRPVSPWKVVQFLFEPIGRPFLKLGE